MSSEEIRPNLLTVVPGNINIENFVPGRVYKEAIMIYNTCNVPIVLNLKSSDKNKLTINESKIRIGVNQSKKLDILIQDKLNYKYTKMPINQKKLFIHMKGELIDEKYEINLFYYQKNRLNNGKLSNQNLINNLRQNNQYMINNKYNELSNGYLTENPNNYMHYNNINNINNYKNNIYYNNNNIPLENESIYNNHSNSYMSIGPNDNEEIITLKNIINDLLSKINSLSPLLNQNKTNNFYNNSNLSISNSSLYIIGNKYQKEIKNKYKLEDNIDNKRVISRNKILELENSTLLQRIKCLEEKVFFYENNNKEKIDGFSKNNDFNFNNIQNLSENRKESKQNNLYNNNKYINDFKNNINKKLLNINININDEKEMFDNLNKNKQKQNNIEFFKK